MLEIACLLAVLVLVAPTPAEAYLDPGSGSMLLQLLLGGVAGIAVLFRLYWRRLLDLFGEGKPPAEEPAGEQPPQARP